MLRNLRNAFPLLVLAVPALAQGVTLRLDPVADATASSDLPAWNYGTSAELTFGKDFTITPSFRTWFTRGHVRFDLSGVGQPTPPARATFFWYQTRANAAGCLDVALHRLTQTWAEATVTWNSKPTHDATVVSRACVGNSFELGWKTFDVTALVAGWMTNQYPNYGFVIRDPSESTAGAARPGYGASRENPNAAIRPYLLLEWVYPYGTGCGPNATKPTLELALGTPRLGQPFTLKGALLAPAAPSLFLMGESRTQWGAIRLPYDLGAIGFAGCQLQTAIALSLGLGSDPAGSVIVNLLVPNDPGLLGDDYFVQLANLGAGAQLFMTPGLCFRVY